MEHRPFIIEPEEPAPQEPLSAPDAAMEPPVQDLEVARPPSPHPYVGVLEEIGSVLASAEHLSNEERDSLGQAAQALLTFLREAPELPATQYVLPEDLITTDQATQILGFRSGGAVHYFVRRGQLTPHHTRKIGKYTKHFFTLTELERFRSGAGP